MANRDVALDLAPTDSEDKSSAHNLAPPKKRGNLKVRISADTETTVPTSATSFRPHHHRRDPSTPRMLVKEETPWSKSHDKTWWGIAAIASLPFPSLAFGALQRKSAKDYTADWVASLSTEELIFDFISSFFAYVINLIIIRKTMPDALQLMWSRLVKKFGKDPIRTFILVVLTVGAIFTALGIGCTAFFWTTKTTFGLTYPWLVWAVNTIATVIYGAVFWASRFFGIVKLIDWMQREWAQQVYKRKLRSIKNKFLHPLNHTIDERLKKEGLTLGVAKEDDESILLITFEELQCLINTLPEGENLYDWKKEIVATIWLIVEILLTALVLFSILPTFGQKCFDGLQKTFGISHESANESSFGWAVFTSLFSFATDALYMRQIFSMKERFWDAMAHLKEMYHEPTSGFINITWKWTKLVAWPLVILGANILACLGVYNLTLGTAQESDNVFVKEGWIPTPPPADPTAAAPHGPEIQGPTPIVSDTPSTHSSTARIDKLMTLGELQAGAGTLVVITNAGFCYERAMPNPVEVKQGAKEIIPITIGQIPTHSERKEPETEINAQARVPELKQEAGHETERAAKAADITPLPNWVDMSSRYLSQYGVTQESRDYLDGFAMFRSRRRTSSSHTPAITPRSAPA